MMRTVRVAVISDIHANLHALDAVMADVDGARPDELWCLGDVIGYGPRPNECTARVALRADVCLVGNHDLVVLGTHGVGIEAFNEEAAAAARWTRAELADEARAFLATLEPLAVRNGVALFHASARDPVWEYVLDGESALASIQLAREPLVLVGHSHIALEIALVDATLTGGLARAGRVVDLSQGRRLLNPGSVGQPRDGDARAAWLLLDLGERRAEFHRIEYDVARTQQEMAAAGLPRALADRLAAGV
jgi:diadenosine tetraphosphatase ApaH/serine/threonine PP2A family protein phosphatase